MGKPILVTTPSGNIGRHVVRSLVDSGQSVRVISRNPDKLDADISERVDIITGSLDDVSILAEAIDGVDSLFWCVPASHTQDNVLEYYLHFTRAITKAIKQSRLKRLVSISSGGKGLAKNSGAISALHAMEDMLDKTGIDTKHLRCGNFMENFLWQVQPIKNKGIFFYPFPADYPMPMVAVQDIGSEAAKWLIDPSWSGQSHIGVHGFEDLTLDQVATIFSEVLNKPVRFQSIPVQAYYELMLRNGCSSAFSQSLIDMFAEVAEGIYQAEPRTDDATTPTTLKNWTERILLPMMQADE